MYMLTETDTLTVEMVEKIVEALKAAEEANPPPEYFILGYLNVNKS